MTSFDVAPDRQHVLFSGPGYSYDICYSRYWGYAPVSVGATGGKRAVAMTPNAVKWAFSPTGAHLAFISAGIGQYYSACSGSGVLSFANGDGTQVTKLGDTVADFVFGGETIYFYDSVFVGIMRLVRFRETDSSPAVLDSAPYPGWTRQSQGFPAYVMVPSPDGEAIAYCRPAPDYVQPDCFLLPPGVDPAAAIPIQGAGAWPSFAWTTDGDWLIAGNLALSRDGMTKRDFGGTCTPPAPSPDGKVVLFRAGTNPDCDTMLVVAPLDGSSATRLGPLPAGTFDWKFQFIKGRDEVLAYPSSYDALFVAPASGGPFEELRLPEGSVGMFAFEVQPDGSVWRLDSSAPQIPPSGPPSSWPILRLHAGAPPETIVPSATSLPVHETEGRHAILVQEGWLPPYQGALHLLGPDLRWPGAILPAFVGIAADSPYQPAAGFNFRFVGRTAVYTTNPSWIVSNETWNLAAATEDGGITAPLVSGVAMYRAVDHSLYFVKNDDRSLWRLDVPQP